MTNSSKQLIYVIMHRWKGHLSPLSTNHVPRVCVSTPTSQQESHRFFPQTWVSPVWVLRYSSSSTTAMDGWMDCRMDGWIIFFLHNQSFLCFLKSGSSFCVFLFHSRCLQLAKGNSFQTENCWLDSYNSESKSTEKATCVCGSYYTINRPIEKKKKTPFSKITHQKQS